MFGLHILLLYNLKPGRLGTTDNGVLWTFSTDLSWWLSSHWQSIGIIKKINTCEPLLVYEIKTFPAVRIGNNCTNCVGFIVKCWLLMVTTVLWLPHDILAQTFLTSLLQFIFFAHPPFSPSLSTISGSLRQFLTLYWMSWRISVTTFRPKCSFPIWNITNKQANPKMNFAAVLFLKTKRKVNKSGQFSARL